MRYTENNLTSPSYNMNKAPTRFLLSYISPPSSQHSTRAHKKKRKKSMKHHKKKNAHKKRHTSNKRNVYVANSQKKV